MSNVNMTVNVDGDGAGGCCAGLTHQVRVYWNEVTDGSVTGPMSVENAQAFVVALANNPNLKRAVIEMAGT